MQSTQEASDSLRDLFARGQHQSILQATVENPDYSWPAEDTTEVTSSLAYLGRIDEAVALYQLHASNLSRDEQIACRFFMGLGYIRQSDYNQGHGLFQENHDHLDDASYLAQFYIYQGLAVHRWFTHSFQEARDLAKQAYLAALSAQFFYGRTLALDLLGHAHVAVGEVSKGLAELERAHDYFKKLGDCANASICYLAINGYQAQYGVYRDEGMHSLKELVKETKLKNNTHSVSFLLTELARQYSLQGRLKESEKALQELSQITLKTGHRRHEALLYQRQAQNLFLQGNYDRCIERLMQGRAIIDETIDLSYLLASLGLHAKACLAKQDEEGAAQLLTRIQVLTEKTGSGWSTRILNRGKKSGSDQARRGNDLLGDRIDDILTGDLTFGEKVEAIITSELFSLIADVLDLPRTKKLMILNLQPSSVMIYDSGEVRWFPQTFSGNMLEVLRLIANGRSSKRELIETIWGYTYHPMRHDHLIYSLMTRIRQALGDYQEWLVTTASGYDLASGVQLRVHVNAIEEVQQEADDSQDDVAISDSINHRQLKIMRYLGRNDSIDLKTCLDMFESVSKVTLSRDLSSLSSQGLVQRIGRGRNTRYMKATAEQSAP
ncbi:helix-turn-helix domain-containing protein [Pseudobacteriovorax antillogorgiicola]|uniref:HTH deoR-type domain-containing protein n=1 Tax=Pseudobacteriovorax antillogorgiicola TaxID=1513793 RepID=A0A1Y6CDU5_9BACT|nr:helix-turn-helix domain-containing protein [Pseudobacteriovorax antillogorgiicola]TCS47951.1 hypothetical protein EDD56_11962 [Pseudobacteriovorax antillogorgiicola]SMF58134.1 hypothetical protein SAMN06296036_11963 [Pseudobacteriovorax antillogorgiicola]